MSRFSFSPAPGPTQSIQPRVRVAAFGEGYQQRVGDGIHTMPRSWSIQFTRLTADIDLIEAFLAARAGVESFDWLPPSGVDGKWICKSWQRTVSFNQIQAVNVVFEEVYGD